MILVTGATGHLGKLTIDFLLKKGIQASQIIAFVRNEAKADDLKAKGVNVKIGDYENYGSLKEAFKGVSKLLLISGTDLANRTEQHINVVKAAREAGVQHVLYTSVGRKNETETLPIYQLAQAHIDTENALKASGLNYTIFKNTIYMDIMPMFIGGNVLETFAIYLPAGNGKSAPALRSEMAEATANVLASAGHENKTYDFTNVEAYSYTDVAGYLTEITGKEIRYTPQSVEEYTETLRNAGIPAEYVDTFSAFALAQEQGEFDMVSNDLEKLLGRKPTSLKDFLKTIYAAGI